MKEITQTRLKEVLSYNPETGDFERLRHPRLDGRVGQKRQDGYISIGVDGGYYMAHRLAWLYVHGYLPRFIDHINMRRDDNRLSNLRPCTQAQNNANCHARSHNKSGFKGVAFHPKSGRWHALISVNKKQRRLGCFATPEEAHAAYLKAANESFGEFARAA